MAEFDPSRFVDPDVQTSEDTGQLNQGFDPSQFVDPDAQQERPQSMDTGQQAAPQENPLGTVGDVILGAGRAIGPIARLPARGIAALTGSQAAKRSLAAQALREEKQFEQAQKRSPVATTIANLAAETAKFATIPGGTSLGLLGRLGVGSATGAGIGALENIASEQDDKRSLLADVGIGAATGLAGGALAEVASKGLARAAGSKVGRILSRGEKAAGARRITGVDEDIGLSLSERLPGSETLRQQTRRAFLSKKNQNILEKSINKRDVITREKFDKLVGSLVREGDDVARQNADDIFRSLDNVPAPKDATDLVTSDPIIGNAFKQVQSNPNLGAQNLQAGSFGQLRLVKEALDNQVSVLKRQGANVEVKNLARAKNRLVEALDKAEPKYKLGRSISQRLKIKQNIQDELDTIREAGEDISPENIYTKLFANKSKRADFLDEIKAAGGDVEGARKLINTLQAIKKGGLRGKLKRTPGIAGALSRPGGFKELGVDAIRLGLTKSDGKALSELFTDPALTTRIKNAQTIESAIKGLGQALTKATAASTTGE